METAGSEPKGGMRVGYATLLLHRYRTVAKTKGFVRATLASLLAFAASLGFSLMAGVYSNIHASNHVSDIILSNTPAFNLDGAFVYGTFAFTFFVVLIALLHPRRIPFIFSCLAVFYITRAGFVTLTHIAPFPDRAAVDFGATIRSYFFGSDLFFSGHTGTPFLLALIYWQEHALRIVFIACSIIFAAIVLLAHLHYSIDVASAFFITYAIYHLCLQFFPGYKQLFDDEEAHPDLS